MLWWLGDVQSSLRSPQLSPASTFPCADVLGDAGGGPRKEDTRSKSGASGMVRLGCTRKMRQAGSESSKATKEWIL